MIKAKFKGVNGDIIVLGIDAENVKRLKDGKPIHVKGTDIDTDSDIYIVYGHTLDDIAKWLQLLLGGQ